MAKRNTTVEPDLAFLTQSHGGYKLSDFLDSDVLLYKLGDTTVKSEEYGESIATRAILVELCNWDDDDDAPDFFIKGEIFIFGKVIREALNKHNFVLGTIKKPGRAYTIRNISDENTEKVRAKWPQIWPDLQAAANEADEDFATRQDSGDHKDDDKPEY